MSEPDPRDQSSGSADEPDPGTATGRSDESRGFTGRREAHGATTEPGEVVDQVDDIRRQREGDNVDPSSDSEQLDDHQGHSDAPGVDPRDR